jgi:hypothetical protein
MSDEPVSKYTRPDKNWQDRRDYRQAARDEYMVETRTPVWPEHRIRGDGDDGTPWSELWCETVGERVAYALARQRYPEDAGEKSFEKLVMRLALMADRLTFPNYSELPSSLPNELRETILAGLIGMLFPELAGAAASELADGLLCERRCRKIHWVRRDDPPC